MTGPHTDSKKLPACKDRCPNRCGTGRNLVVCIDGTSNKFGPKSTNIVELYSRLIKDEGQLTFYDSGIGTYAEPSWKSLGYVKQIVAKKADLALALRFETILLDAYRWLAEMFKDGDRIFLFGFSRGAYQVRVLAGMIERVGLIHKGNQAQIPFAYELYAKSEEGHARKLSEKKMRKSPQDLHLKFKTTFCRENVHVHFVGVWDTVSSIGIRRPRDGLPLTISGMDHVCYFRHALALDERRVKFLPEYAYGGTALDSEHTESNIWQTKNLRLSPSNTPQQKHNKENHLDAPSLQPRKKEVWFSGTHSDVGGGNEINTDLNHYGPALRWMIHEAITVGLCVKDREGNLEDSITSTKSLRSFWWPFELCFFRRLTYKDQKSITYRPHLGAHRRIVEGQLIHKTAYDHYRDRKGYFETRLPQSWSNEGRLDDSKIEWDLTDKVQYNLRLLLETVEQTDRKGSNSLDSTLFLSHLRALLEISYSTEGTISLLESVEDVYTILTGICNNDSDRSHALTIITWIMINVARVSGSKQRYRNASTLTRFRDALAQQHWHPDFIARELRSNRGRNPAIFVQSLNQTKISVLYT